MGVKRMIRKKPSCLLRAESSKLSGGIHVYVIKLFSVHEMLMYVCMYVCMCVCIYVFTFV